eukprot:TRINITY_DN2827_c0_g1_i2.p1 TRINITY_DN2827_c0_g1~~TRINITY_DN2827_c0_g1_i2.p1  ORF type:complete len:544 (-),score=33.83 TRINITY_DN2827_c0_g1_i2:17-1510(-)
MDLALSVGVNQAQLLAGINSYFSVEDSVGEVTDYYSAPGPMIVIMCMFYYSLFVLTDLQQAVRTVFALIALPRAERTKIESNVLVSISYTRLTLSICVVIVRIAVAFTLLITGLVWLSVTSEITESILNTAALNFVLELDDLLFYAAFPSAVQNFVTDMRPLKLRRPRWTLEASLPLIVAVFSIFTVCSLVMVENMHDMLRTRTELCGGFQDFVSAKNGLGIMASRRTGRSGSVDVLNMYELQAVLEVTHADSPGASALFRQMLWFDDNVAEFDSTLKQTATSLSREMPCVDHGDTPWAQSYETQYSSMFENLVALVSRETGEVFAEKFTCRDYEAVCDDSRYPIMRAKCAETCGCGNATSGLLISGTSQYGGCPPTCQSRVQEQINDAVCLDLPVTSKAPQDAPVRLAWKRYWDAFPQFAQMYFPDRVDAFTSIADAMVAGGCNNTGNPVSGESFCWGDTGFHPYHGLGTILAFCPHTCCRESEAGARPSDCRQVC